MIRHIRTMRMINTALAGCTLLALVGLLLLLPTYEMIRTRAQALQLYTRELEANGVVISETDIALLQSRIKLLREKLTVHITYAPLTYVEVVEQHQVDGVRITGYDIENPEKQMMQIRGFATNRQVLQQFITVLQADTRIVVVDSPITNFVKSSEGEFTLMITFKQL